MKNYKSFVLAVAVVPKGRPASPILSGPTAETSMFSILAK